MNQQFSSGCSIRFSVSDWFAVRKLIVASLVPAAALFLIFLAACGLIAQAFVTLLIFGCMAVFGWSLGSLIARSSLNWRVALTVVGAAVLGIVLFGLAADIIVHANLGSNYSALVWATAAVSTAAATHYACRHVGDISHAQLPNAGLRIGGSTPKVDRCSIEAVSANGEQHDD